MSTSRSTHGDKFVGAGLILLGLPVAYALYTSLDARPENSRLAQTSVTTPSAGKVPPYSQDSSRERPSTNGTKNTPIENKDATRQTFPLIKVAIPIDIPRYVAEAMSSDSPDQAMRAADLLQICESATSIRDSLEGQRGRNAIGAAQLAELIALSEQRLRDCQTVTGEVGALQLPLLKRALLANTFGAAVRYGDLINYEVPTDLLSTLTANLKSDAAKGDFNSAARLGLYGDRLGLSIGEILTHAIYAQKLAPPAKAELIEIATKSRMLGVSEQVLLQAKRDAGKLLEGIELRR